MAQTMPRALRSIRFLRITSWSPSIVVQLLAANDSAGGGAFDRAQGRGRGGDRQAARSGRARPQRRRFGPGAVATEPLERFEPRAGPGFAFGQTTNGERGPIWSSNGYNPAPVTAITCPVIPAPLRSKEKDGLGDVLTFGPSAQIFSRAASGDPCRRSWTHRRGSSRPEPQQATTVVGSDGRPLSLWPRDAHGNFLAGLGLEANCP
jgi:hypothetical protein